jgi:alpha-tubulin suppressor-like RCC1 family protein
MAYFSFNGANRRLPGVSNSHLRHSSWIVLLLSFGHGSRGQQVFFKLTGQLKMERQQFGGAAIHNSTSGQKCGASGLVWNPGVYLWGHRDEGLFRGNRHKTVRE